MRSVTGAAPGREKMTCADFQRGLPEIFESGSTTEQDEHLKNCPVCADLVADLKYIAEQAKLLVPMHDPSPRVWDGIQESLEKEGLMKSRVSRKGALGVTH